MVTQMRLQSAHRRAELLRTALDRAVPRRQRAANVILHALNDRRPRAGFDAIEIPAQQPEQQSVCADNRLIEYRRGKGDGTPHSPAMKPAPEGVFDLRDVLRTRVDGQADVARTKRAPTHHAQEIQIEKRGLIVRL